MAKLEKRKTGFTFVEISLVLAVSALMLVGFISGISATINRQRYSDASNDFADFLRRIYSEVTNVQNPRTGTLFSVTGPNNAEYYYCNLAGLSAHQSGILQTSKSDGYPGRTNCAIYGKLISFGESDDGTLYVYDVVGRATDITHPISVATTTEELASVYLDTLTLAQRTTGDCSVTTAAAVESYHPSWGSHIETTNKETENFTGALLIVRSPKSGAVRTLVMQGQTMNFQKVINDNNIASCNQIDSIMNEVNQERASVVNHLLGESDNNKFEMKEADFCIGYDGLFSFFGERNNIRVKADGHNSTAVEFVQTDLSPDEGGNRC